MSYVQGQTPNTNLNYIDASGLLATGITEAIVIPVPDGTNTAFEIKDGGGTVYAHVSGSGYFEIDKSL